MLIMGDSSLYDNVENRQDVIGKKLPIDLPGVEGISQQLLDKLEVAIYTCDSRGYITHYNKAAAALWGTEPEIGKDLWCGSWRIYKPDGITPLPLDECPMAVALKEGRPVNGQEIIIERPNGERSYVVPNPRPFFDDQGRVIGAVNLLIDITNYKGIEQKEAHLAAIVQSSDDAIISKTLGGVITSWNAAAERIFGYAAHEMIGQSLLKIIPRDRWDEEYAIQEQLKKGNKIDHYETKRLTRDNRLLDVSLTISPLRDKQGNITGASKIARDITRQKQVEHDIRESEERYRLAVQTANLGTWALDPLSMDIVCSSECRSVFGVSDEEKINLDFLLNLVHPDDRILFQDKLDWLFNPENVDDYDIECRLIRLGDKSTRWIRIRGKMYFNAERRPENLIGTMLDITDERLAKERLERTVKEKTLELRNRNAQLHRSNHDLEQFAYIASHDLQEPLRKIQAFIDIISEADDKEISVTYFEKIRQSANRMSTLIKDVLNYSRLEKNESLFKEINLNSVLEEVKMDYESQIAGKQAVIKSTGLPVIKGIPMQLRQLFANLISNALKFSSKNPVLSIVAHPVPVETMKNYPQLETGKEYVELVFSDNGIGFDQKYAEKIFVIFQRLHNRTQYSGTGIGLALCKKIVENHHGLITGRSEPGKGSVFSVFLPGNIPSFSRRMA